MFSPQSNEFAAFHEAGHAVVAKSLPFILKVTKVSIETDASCNMRGVVDCVIPNTWYGARDCFITMAGGMAAENLAYGKFDSTGCRNDLLQMRDLYKKHGYHFKIRPLTKHVSSINFSKVFSSAMTEHEAVCFDNAYSLAKDIIKASSTLYNKTVYTLLKEMKIIDFK